MKPRGRQMMAWLLTAAVTLSGNSFTVLADEMDVQVQQETTGNEEEIFAAEDVKNVQDVDVDTEDSTENSFDEETQDEIRIEDAEGSDPESEEELQIEEAADDSENLILETQDDVSVFSSEDDNAGMRVEYYFPENDVILLGWTYDINKIYDGYVWGDQNDGKFRVTVTNVTVTNVPDENESEETAAAPVCEIESSDDNGWHLRAKRFGTAEVTLTYKDYYGEEKEHTFNIHVNGEKYILQAQYPVSDNNLLRNSEQEFPFTVRHLWRYNDEDQGDVVLENTDWALNFAPAEDGWKYDTDILTDVSLNDNKVTVKSGDVTGGTDILLKAVINTNNGQEEALCNLWVNVRNDYDVLYPESLDVATGGTLDLNDQKVGLCVKNVKENEETDQTDVTYEVEYDENQWENSAEEGTLPILRRMTNEGTELTIIAKNKDGNELCRRNYQFGYEDYSVWFKELREGDYSTYFYADEEGALELNTENLENKDISISWEVGYRTEEPEGEGDSFVSAEGIPGENIFWSTNDENKYSLSVDGGKLSEAYKWLRAQNEGENYWFEARAHVNVNGVEVCMAQAGINTRDTCEDYYLPEDEVILLDDDYWINKNYDGYVQNKDNPDGRNFNFALTNVSVSNAEDEADETPVCEINDPDENGWNIHAKRFGTAVVTLTYNDFSGEKREHSFNLYVNSDRFVLEPQWPAAGSCMLKNSETMLSFILNHDWRRSDEDQGSEEVQDWTLEFAPDENGYAYDTNLLESVEINGHELTIISGEETWGTDISLKAVILAEDDNKEDVAFNQVHIEVCEEYDVLYPERIENINAGDVLNFNTCDLNVKHIKENKEPYIRDDVTYDFEYDTNMWTDEASEGQFPILRRKTADGTQVTVIARDGEGNEIGRREYGMDGLDYSVWFENLRGDSVDFTFAFENEQYELSLNTEKLDERGVKDSAKIIWSVGYAYTGENEEDVSKTDIPEDYTFWSENPKDNSKLIIDSSKLTKAYDWLHGQVSGDCWFEIRAGVELGGVIVSEYAYTGLGEVCRNEEEYYINFGATLNMVPGNTLWLDDFLEGSIRDKDHPYGTEIRVEVTKVSVDDTSCCRVAYQGNGWSVKALKCGTATLELVYTDYHGKQQRGEFTVSVQDETYWMNYNLERGEMLPGETKEFTISVYRATKDNPDGEIVDPAQNKYSVTVEKHNSKDPIEVTADANGKITIKVNENAEPGQSYGFCISAEAKDAEENLLWSVSGDVNVYVMERYPDKIQLAKEVNLNPVLGDTFDINEYKPTLLRYNPDSEADDKWEELTIDNENFRLVLSWDDDVWNAQNESLLPVLKRTGKARGAIVLIAEKYDPDSDKWYEIARDSYYVSTIFDKDAECTHIWETIVDEKGNCGKAEKRHQTCTACQKTEQLPDIPATGRHQMSGWKVTKQATALAAGTKEQICTECGLKQQQTIPKLTATLTLNVPENKTLPMKMKQTYQLKVSGLADGDKVVSWTSSNKKIATVSGSGKLKALKKKGKTTITVKLASGKTAKFTVKVQKTDVATTSLTVLNKATGKKMPKTVSLKVKKKLSLTATAAPVTSKQKVTYSTSNKSIATVNAKGVITAKKKGTVTITVKSGKKKVKVKVKVTK